MHFINDEIQKSIFLLEKIQQDKALLRTVDEVANHCVNALKNAKKILFAGNGGSAADSQHLAAELVSRLQYDRPGLSGIALTTDTSALTAIGNDYSFDVIFSRQVEAIGQEGDVFFGISTSGKSANILKAFEAARQKKLTTIGLTGAHAPMMAERCDFLVNVPSKETQKIQECHILLGHIICALVEERMYGECYRPNRVAIAK